MSHSFLHKHYQKQKTKLFDLDPCAHFWHLTTHILWIQTKSRGAQLTQTFSHLATTDGSWCVVYSCEMQRFGEWGTYSTITRVKMIPEPFPTNEGPGRYCSATHLESIKHPKPHQQTSQCCSLGPEFKPTPKKWVLRSCHLWQQQICNPNCTIFTKAQTISRSNSHGPWRLFYIKPGLWCHVSTNFWPSLPRQKKVVLSLAGRLC